jgi:GNAT superfamily N-acetyltransferase
MIGYRAAVPADGAELALVAQTIFTATFGHLYPPDDLAAFIDQALGPNGLPAHIGQGDYTIRLATHDGRIIGFAKTGPVVFPGDWPADFIELHQLYVLPEFHGTAVGVALMDWALAHARTQGKRAMILSVYIDNHRARRFYARYGFIDIGRYDFHVGNTIDEDRLMRLWL